MTRSDPLRPNRADARSPLQAPLQALAAAVRRVRGAVLTNARPFARYLISGGLTFLAYLAALIGGIEWIGLASGVAAGLAVGVAGLANYALLKVFVFRSDSPHRTAGPRYFVLLGGNAAANALVTWVAADLMGFPYLAVQAVYLTLASVAVFSLSKTRVFQTLPPVQ